MTEEKMTNFAKKWAKIYAKEYPKHIETSPETIKLLDDKYVRRWIIVSAFGITFALLIIVFSYTTNVNSKLEIYKGDMYQTTITTNKEISGIKTDVGEIKTNVNWLTKFFNESNINMN